jgi:hypothetical protein
MGVAWCDNLAQVGTSFSRSEWRKALRWGLDERITILGLLEMDLEVHKAIMAEELERSLRCSDRCDLPVELYKARARVNEIAVDRVTEAERLPRQLVWVADVLIDLGLPLIEDNPQLPKTVQDTLAIVALILECLQRAWDSGAGPWD